MRPPPHGRSSSPISRRPSAAWRPTRALLEAWRTLYPLAIAEPRLRKAWELQAYTWLFTDRFWRSEANVRAALRFASSQPAQPPDGFVGQVDAALSHDARERLPNLNVPT